MMLLFIWYAYSIISILLWFPSNLNLDPDIINQSSPSSAAAGWKVCLWAFATVYRLDQSPKNSEAESKKKHGFIKDIALICLDFWQTFAEIYGIPSIVYEMYSVDFRLKVFLGTQDSAFSEDRLEGVWLTFLWWSFTPQKSSIDTKNGHIQKEPPFPNHHFGYPC